MEQAVTIKDIFAMFDRSEQERRETERLLKESWRETDRELKEMQKEMRDSAKQLNKQMGDLGLRFGDLAEEMVKAGILDKVNALGYRFVDFDENHVLRDTATGQRIAEIDLVLYDGDAVMAVEVKTKLETEDVKDHIIRLDKMRANAQNKVWEHRKLLSAVAGAVISKEVKAFALNHGFFLICQSGENLKVEPPSGAAREW
ncbi:hypothetical protein AGMMS50268_21390 [Spirochaetia bacterium]|nr:hypothetical protein AGMMS50268_21390 [Spirochaetia bacterium]